MPMPPVHFVVGAGLSGAVCAVAGAVRRRWLIGLPLVVSVCGALALVPDLLAGGVEHMATLGSRGWSHAPWMNAFFAHPLLDEIAWLQTPEVAAKAFQLAALFYLATTCGYAAFIQWRLPRMKEADEALAQVRAGARNLRPLAAAVGLVPVLMLGASVGWILRTARLPEADRVDSHEWSRLVRRRMRVDTGETLGLVSGVGWETGEWLIGDLGSHTTFSGGTARVADVAERAQANRCQFVVLTDGAGLVSREQVAAHAAEMAAARAKFRDLAILSGLDGGGPAVLVAPQANESQLLAEFHEQFAGAASLGSPSALAWLKARSRAPAPTPVALVQSPGRGTWPELFTWLRANEVFLGIAGLSGGARGSAGAWDPRIAEIGGAWDELLDRGFQVWGAAAAAGFRDPAKHYWPGEHVRTHVWCRGRAPAHVVEGLRAGCLWADQGGIVKSLRFDFVAPLLERPARMGEVAWVEPGAETSVELILELPATDLAGREARIDEVEFISNFHGGAQVLGRVRSVRSHRMMRVPLPPAEDHNGGMGFTVRARGVRRLEGGGELWFYTNPIRVLVHEGARPDAEIVVEPPPKPVKPGTKKPPDPRPRTDTSPKPKTSTPIGPGPVPRKFADPLDDIGLPREVHVVEFETFGKKPGRHWRGLWTSMVADRGPAIGDDELLVAFQRQVTLGEGTRLFFRCRAQSCHRVRVLLHTTRSAKPYELVRELVNDSWMAFDVSLRDAFHPPLGAPGRLGPPDEAAGIRGDEIKQIEWRAEALEPKANFFITDFVVYEQTLSARAALARLRTGDTQPKSQDRLTGTLEQTLLDTQALGAPSEAWRKRAQALETRLAACRPRLYQESKAAVFAALGAVEGELDGIAAEARLLALQTQMARAFDQPDPSYAVGLAGPTERVSARNPALPFRGLIGNRIELSAAAREAESFQIAVMALWQPLRAVDVTWTGFTEDAGARAGLPESAISAAVAAELWTYPRADLPASRTGWMPDPLLPFQPFDVEPGGLRTVLLTVRVPIDLPPGDYTAKVTVRPEGVEPVTATVKLHRWGFALPGGSFPVLAPIDERQVRDYYADSKTVPEARRRQLYSVLLSHRVNPMPLILADEDATLADLTWCLERDLDLAVVHRAASATAGSDSAIERAARYAELIRLAGWGERGAVLLPLLRDRGQRQAFARATKGLSRSYPSLLLVAGGDGDPPGGSTADYWRRPLGIETPRLPGSEAVTVRRTRTTRREAWELDRVARDYPDANLTLANRLIESRSLPWLAWRHGVRALVLGGVTDWDTNNRGRNLLVYPSPTGDILASLRLVALRDGVEDYEYLWLLWDRAHRLRERAPQRHLGVLSAYDQAIDDIARRVGSLTHPIDNPAALAALRARIARLVERLDTTWWDEVDASDDLPAPSPKLTATPADGQVHLAWRRSPDEEVDSYHVYRSCHAKRGFVRITRFPLKTLAYVDEGLSNSETYHYFIRSWKPGDVEGPRTKTADATPKPAPKVVWETMGDLTRNSDGPFRVGLRLTGPGTRGALPLVRPQIDYCLSDGVYDGFEEMTRGDDLVWRFDVPDLGWRRQAGKTLKLQVRIIDRRSKVVTPAVEHTELVDEARRPAP